jgi:hypothetical protein
VIAQKLQGWFSEVTVLALLLSTLWGQAAAGAAAASQDQARGAVVHREEL